MKMKSILTLSILAFLCTNVPNTGAAETNADVILRAMNDELQRNMRELSLGDLPRPYNIEYILSKRHRIGAHAILGIVDDLDTAEVASLTVRVRVGAPKFDNTNFFDVSLGFFGSSDDEEAFKNRRIPTDLTYDQLRRELWLATDACYKQSLEIYAKKMATVRNRTRTDTTWDFFLNPGEITEDLSGRDLSASPADIVNLVQQVSSEFRSAPHVQASRVGMEFVPEEIFYVNSEGRQTHKWDVFAGVEMIAICQAEDGMPLSEIYSAYGRSPSDLPSIDSLKRAARHLIQQLDEQRSAGTIEPYSGPVLFEGQAAAEILAMEFAPNLISQRTPMSASGFSTGSSTKAFQNKIGARVLPEWLSMRATPSTKSYETTAVAGHYRIDDEGMRAEDVQLVEKGYLRGLLSSRVPTRRIDRSNGHQRGGGAMISVLDLSCEDEDRILNAIDMKERLIELIEDRDLEYGIIIRKVLDRNIFFTGLIPMLQGDIPMSSGQGSVGLLEAFRVYPDGREEPIRGVEVAGFSTFLFKDLMAVGSTKIVHNYLAPAVIPSFITGGSQYIISTIITPDLLFEDVEVKPREGDLPTPPRLESPLSETK